jgi:hypothetical protein
MAKESCVLCGSSYLTGDDAIAAFRDANTPQATVPLAKPQAVGMKYTLLIYVPGGSGYDVLCHLESDTPFMPIARGDLLNPRSWSHRSRDLTDPACPHGVVLRVTGLEHFICEAGGRVSRHSIGVFTAALDDSAESRP